MYNFIFRVFLSKIPPEMAHGLAFRLLGCLEAVPFASLLLRRRFSPNDPVLRIQVFGREFPGPLGLAAGFDKDAARPDAFRMIGFGFAEVGTITAKPQPGNPKPRLFRLPADRALVNRMGFNSKGAEAVAARLSARRNRSFIVGANIGKTKTVADSESVADYVASAKLLAGLVDYLVINVSSPNTPGLRKLQSVDRLRPLITAVRQSVERSGAHDLPLLIKIAPDLSDAEIDSIADLAVELGLEGIIATNTPASRPNLTTDPEYVRAIGAGGLSGAPLRERSLEVLQRLRARVGDKLILIACGGIDTADDAWERIIMGATLLEAYTGLVYGGPLWASRIHDDLARRARRAGFNSIQEAVGTGHRQGRQGLSTPSSNPLRALWCLSCGIIACLLRRRWLYDI